MLKGKSGETVWVALKQLVSLVLSTLAATLVPPVPKPELSLTWGWKKVSEHTNEWLRMNQLVHAGWGVMRDWGGDGDLRLRRTVSW